jgi:PUB domain
VTLRSSRPPAAACLVAAQERVRQLSNKSGLVVAAAVAVAVVINQQSRVTVDQSHNQQTKQALNRARDAQVYRCSCFRVHFTLAMFRKVADRISGVLAEATRSEDDRKVDRLTALGFPAHEASRALTEAQGNVDRAAEMLLSRNSGAFHGSSSSSSSHSQYQSSTSQEEADLQRAMQASLRVNQPTAATARTRTAASSRAGQAAVSRLTSGKQAGTIPAATASNALAAHHPKVKLVPKLQDKSKEEQILRTADRCKAHYAAVDTLLRALTMLQQNPTNEKYRRIDTSSAGYQKSVAPAPGAQGFLLAMNYRRSGSYYIMDSHMIDPALLYLGISALEQVKLSSEYIQAKQRADFAQEMVAVTQGADLSESEGLARANHMSQCPTEPSQGRGALMQVQMANEVIRRRFDSDDTLQDVLHWLGAHGSQIPARLQSREWSLIDRNVYPLAPIDCQVNASRTLQYLGCWPSGKLEIVPSSAEWGSGQSTNEKPGSRRGLGAAPREVL